MAETNGVLRRYSGWWDAHTLSFSSQATGNHSSCMLGCDHGGFELLHGFAVAFAIVKEMPV
jgi:hypothetical protein